MKIKVCIDKDVYERLISFGDISDVINRILAEGEAGNIQIFDLPATPLANPSRYVVDITNTYYLELYATYGPTCTRISLKRIIQYFVDIEGYNLCGWTIADNIEQLELERRVCLLRAISSLQKLRECYPYYQQDSKQYIDEVCERLKNERIKEIQTDVPDKRSISERLKQLSE